MSLFSLIRSQLRTAIGISLPNGSAIRGDLPLPLRFELTRGHLVDVC